MKSQRWAILFLALLTTFTTSAQNEQGDIVIQGYGTLQKDNIFVSAGVGYMFTETLRANVVTSYSCYSKCDSKTVNQNLEGQYYLSDYISLDSLVFSAGGGLSFINLDSDSGNDSEFGYHAFFQANQYFDDYENVSVFYRLEQRKFANIDSTLNLLFGIEITF